jgi:hypothetical protein
MEYKPVCIFITTLLHWAEDKADCIVVGEDLVCPSPPPEGETYIKLHVVEGGDEDVLITVVTDVPTHPFEDVAVTV